MNLICGLQASKLESEHGRSYAQPVSFGKNVRRLRLDKDMRAKELAERLEVKQGTLSDWERDRRGLPETPTLLKFAKALGCSVDDLLQGVDPQYDEIVIELRDLPDHARKRDSTLHTGGSSVPGAPSASTRIQQLEQQLRERDRFISQVENAAIKVVRLFTTTEENRRARADQSGRRGARRKAG